MLTHLPLFSQLRRVMSSHINNIDLSSVILCDLQSRFGLLIIYSGFGPDLRSRSGTVEDIFLFITWLTYQGPGNGTPHVHSGPLGKEG